MLSLTVVLSLLAAQPTRDEVLLECRGPTRRLLGPVLAEAAEVLDVQRRAYVVAWLEEHRVRAEECGAVLEAITPSTVTAEVGPLTLRWEPTAPDDPNCFTRLTITGSARTELSWPTPFCFGFPRRLVLEDFNFDGRLDLRLEGPLSMGHSRRFDLILLATRGGRFTWSQELSALDDVQVDAPAQRLTSRVLDEDHVGHRAGWQWKKGALSVVTK